MKLLLLLLAIKKKPELLYDVCHVMLFGLTLRSVIDRTTKIDHVTLLLPFFVVLWL